MTVKLAWLGQTLNFVQISNGHAGPLSPGLQLGNGATINYNSVITW